MANVPAINVTEWAARLALANDSQEVKWMADIVLGTRGRFNPFHGLIGGMSGMLGMTLETLQNVYGHHHPDHNRAAAAAIAQRPKRERPTDTDRYERTQEERASSKAQ